MTSKEMKLIKFKTTITDLRKKFGQFYNYKYYNNYNENKNPLKCLLGENSNNQYVQIILDNSFNKEIFNSQIRVWFPKSNYNDEKITIKELIDECSTKDNEPHDHNLNRKISNFGGEVIFFALMTIAIDNELYNENISIISDMAYIIGFNPEMMNDWIYVVKIILEGKKIDLKKLNTEEGKFFFRELV